MTSVAVDRTSKRVERREREDVRVIHYLGAKTRLLSPIYDAVSGAARPGDTICDLFAGGGVVSSFLLREWSVVSVDIQEYSRVICSALGAHLSPASVLEGREAVLSRALNGRVWQQLRSHVEPLIEVERNALDSSVRGNIDPLCRVTDLAMVQASRDGPRSRGRYDGALARAAAALSKRKQDRRDAVVTRHFGGVYFSWEQAIALDALLVEAHRFEGPLRDVCVSAILATASDVVNTVGKQFAQPIKLRDAHGTPKTHLVRQTIRDRRLDVFSLFSSWMERLSSRQQMGRPGSIAVRADYRDALRDAKLEIDVVYADPPYTRDHYSRFYHVLETMSLRDDPVVSTTKIRSGGVDKASRGVYRADRHQSPFCIKSQAPAAFDGLFRGVASRRVPLILSYSPYSEGGGNRPRLMSVDAITKIASEYFVNVVVLPVDVGHNKFNISSRNRSVDYAAEVLISCTKPKRVRLEVSRKG